MRKFNAPTPANYVEFSDQFTRSVWWPLQMNKYSIMEYLVSRGMDLNQVMRTRPAHSIPDVRNFLLF